MPIPPASDVLAGLRVLDLSRVRAGPCLCAPTRRLGGGCRQDRTAPALADPDGLGGPRHGPDFQNLHRNKRSLTLDLKAPEGREVFLRLCGAGGCGGGKLPPRGDGAARGWGGRCWPKPIRD